MIEMKRDLTRQMALRNATREVRENGHYVPDQTLLEQRDAMRASLEQPKRKRRIPWFAILTIATTIPFFMGDGSGKIMSAVISPEAVQGLKNPNVGNHLGDESAKVSVTIGEMTFEKEITAQDIRAMQSKL